ncbi:MULTISPECIES: PepSY domain-containing protein [Streptomyces]|uniref:PepSY domain-containing protein n=1 Tax=Streptomyces TaxID=1883 RepID=UPI0004CB1ACA|nr:MULTISPECIES: PepSY domain-containing protein [Streptomyces]RPK91032.1 Peptidase propeptide and YPEB domain protein [Streptomyces sp. ADI98-10]
MKRNVTIAAITAAVLIGGTTAATVAFADGGDGDRTPAGSVSAVSLADDNASDDRTDDASDDRAPAAAKTTRITLDQAVAAALKSVPGTVTEAELDDDDDDDDRAVWELDVRGSDKKWHDVKVDAGNGKVVKTRDDDNDDRDRHAPRSSTVTLNAAADAALKTAPGNVTSIDLDDDDDNRGNVLRWDIDIAGKDGEQHELRVDAKTGKVTVDHDDDGDDDDRDDRADEKDDDRDDRDGDDG